MKKERKNKEEPSALMLVIMGAFSFIGCVMFLVVLFLFSLMEFSGGIIGGIISIFGFFVVFMTAGYALVCVFGACFSLLPFWRTLHRKRIKLQAEEGRVSSTPSRKANSKNDIALFLKGISLFALMIAWMNVFILVSNFRSYYNDHGKGKVIEIKERDKLILENGQRLSNPVNHYDDFPALKHISLGDHIEKTPCSLEFTVNGNVYFNKRMFFEQEIKSHSLMFIFGGLFIGLILATIYKIILPEEVLNYWNLQSKAQDKDPSEGVNAEVIDLKRDTQYDSKKDLDGLSEKYMDFSQDLSNSGSRGAFVIISIILIGVISLIVNLFFPFYLVFPIAFCILCFLLGLIMKSGVNKLRIHQNMVVVDMGIGFMRKYQQIEPGQIKGFKVAHSSSTKGKCLQMELLEGKPLDIWGDLEEKDAEELGAKLKDALKKMIPDLDVIVANPGGEDSRLGNYREFGQMLVMAGIGFSVLPLFGLSHRFSDLSQPTGIFWTHIALCIGLYGLGPLVCGRRMTKGDRSGVLFSFLLMLVMLSWISPMVLRNYEMFLFPWLGFSMVLILLVATGLGIWGWSALPTKDKKGRPIPVFRLWYIPILIVALFSAIGYGRLANTKGELITAVKEGDTKKVKELLAEPFASLQLKGERQKSLVHLAVESDSIDTLKFILEAGAEPNRKSQNVNYPIHLAAEKNRLDMVKLLLDHKADVNAENLYEKTILHMAAGKNNLDLVVLAINNGADPVNVGSRGKTPLHEAAASGSREIAALLLRHGADINLKDRYGNSPLLTAAREGKEDMVLFLLRNGASEGIDVLGTVLKENKKRVVFNIFLACAIGDLYFVKKLLVEEAARIKKKDSAGWTPLHWAALSGNPELIKLLIDKGASPKVVTKDWRTPKDIARARGHSDILKILH